MDTSEQIGCGEQPVLSIIIKALNEEEHIARCLQSVMSEMAEYDSEAILVDSLSTDKTVEIAAHFDVCIVQFDSQEDRGCGAAMQLGYQFARGRFIYLLDADMALVPGFLKLAVDYLAAHPDVAGVGGKMIDDRIHTPADRLRASKYANLKPAQFVPTLGGGGLYRRTAIEAVGYLSHRWLQANEEAELGVRLRASGWRLVRLSNPSVIHSGHHETSWNMFKRLWRGGRFIAHGVFLRSAVGKPWIWKTARSVWFVFAPVFIYLVTCGLVAVGVLHGKSLLWGLSFGLASSLGAAFCFLAVRKKNMTDALLSLVSWHLCALGASIGFFRPLRSPMEKIDGRIIHRN